MIEKNMSTKIELHKKMCVLKNFECLKIIWPKNQSNENETLNFKLSFITPKVEKCLVRA